MREGVNDLNVWSHCGSVDYSIIERRKCWYQTIRFIISSSFW